MMFAFFQNRTLAKQAKRHQQEARRIHALHCILNEAEAQVTAAMKARRGTKEAWEAYRKAKHDVLEFDLQMTRRRDERRNFVQSIRDHFSTKGQNNGNA